MKKELQELLDNHKEYKQEVFSLLEQLNQVELYKLPSEDREALKLAINNAEIELNLRNSFITDLEIVLWQK